MFQVVADTTPLNYLVLIDAVDILPRLYGEITVPSVVYFGLVDLHAPAKVRDWATPRPPWLHVASPPGPGPAARRHLDEGERDAITLALQQRANLLLMDERDGVTAARALNLNVVGTLAILDSAAERGWIDLPKAFERLDQTTFRSPRRLMAEMLRHDALRRTERKKP